MRAATRHEVEAGTTLYISREPRHFADFGQSPPPIQTRNAALSRPESDAREVIVLTGEKKPVGHGPSRMRASAWGRDGNSRELLVGNVNELGSSRPLRMRKRISAKHLSGSSARREF